MGFFSWIQSALAIIIESTQVIEHPVTIPDDIAYPYMGGRWLHRRYYTQPGQPRESFMSRSTPGACWFGGDIAYANRLHDAAPDRDGTVVVGFHGSGALPEPMGDFDDIGFLSEVGLGHSLRHVDQK